MIFTQDRPDRKAHPLVLGCITGVYGVRGWLRVNSYTRPKINIFSYLTLLIKVDNIWRNIELEDSQQHGNRLLAKIKGIDTLEDGRHYIHHDLAIMREQLSPLEAGCYYWDDLIGLIVFNQSQIELGRVKDIIETGANDVLIITDDVAGRDRILIPLIMDIYVKKVDLITGTIHVDWQKE